MVGAGVISTGVVTLGAVTWGAFAMTGGSVADCGATVVVAMDPITGSVGNAGSIGETIAGFLRMRGVPEDKE